MITNKIDPTLYNKVKISSNNNEDVDCVVYSNNFLWTKKYLLNNNYNIKAEFPFINAFAVNVMPKTINLLASIRHINYISSEAKVFAQSSVAKKIMNIEKLTSQGYSGKGITIAFIDTGIKQHVDFVLPKNRILLFKDFINFKEKPYDDNGHGTFVASCACGNGFASGNKFSGVAKNANIISLKTLDNNGEAGAFTILEAMQWIYDNHKKYNIKVVCMSFGSQPLESDDPLVRGAEALWNDGVVVVAAAGNSGPEYRTIKSPGVSSKIITVGAMDDSRNENNEPDETKFKVAEFSSCGPSFNFYKPDLITSGVNLDGCDFTDNFYTKMSGTSVSTPLIAGLSALIIEKYPKITPSELKAFLLQNCTKLTGDKNKEGYGYIKLK